MVETIYARKAGTIDWAGQVYIDDGNDAYRFHIASRRFPTKPLAKAWVTRKLRATTPLEPDHLAWGSVEGYRWTGFTFWDDQYGHVSDAESEAIEDSVAWATKNPDGRIVWDDPSQDHQEDPS